TADPESQPDSRVVATSLAANSYHALINHQNKCSGNMCSADAYFPMTVLPFQADHPCRRNSPASTGSLRVHLGLAFYGLD
ncbi:hypothetical protein QWY27_15005, partial [Zwartia sp. IMCC34845]